MRKRNYPFSHKTTTTTNDPFILFFIMFTFMSIDSLLQNHCHDNRTETRVKKHQTLRAKNGKFDSSPLYFAKKTLYFCNFLPNSCDSLTSLWCMDDITALIIFTHFILMFQLYTIKAMSLYDSNRNNRSCLGILQISDANTIQIFLFIIRNHLHLYKDIQITIYCKFLFCWCRLSTM